ncbi:hypothetical protein T05_6886 [Trichinella murrelli]|uniref:Uncharacterized protein n=1 Tax=Trichinella murrelli TaxID=144512 RepID=A0A0V0SWM8_9BILA|nr:hypothetical protein T05_6886 [Trichinella murrelli]
MPQAILKKRFAFKPPLRQISKKYLLSGYASGYASGNCFLKFQIFLSFSKFYPAATPWAMPQAILKKYLLSGYASGNFKKTICLQTTPEANFKKIFALRLCLRLRLRQLFSKISNFSKFFKILPCGYALGYAPGNFKKIFALRLCLRQF